MPTLLLEGRYREDRHGSAAQVWLPPGQLPEPPSWLQGEARELWLRLAPQLSAVGVATDLDEAELAALCDWWGQYRLASDALRQVEDVQSIEHGRLSRAAGHAYKNFSTIAGKFGLNPSDRARLRLPEGEAQDPLGDFVKDKQ